MPLTSNCTVELTGFSRPGKFTEIYMCRNIIWVCCVAQRWRRLVRSSPGGDTWVRSGVKNSIIYYTWSRSPKKRAQRMDHAPMLHTCPPHMNQMTLAETEMDVKFSLYIAWKTTNTTWKERLLSSRLSRGRRGSRKFPENFCWSPTQLTLNSKTFMRTTKLIPGWWGRGSQDSWVQGVSSQPWCVPL